VFDEDNVDEKKKKKKKMTKKVDNEICMYSSWGGGLSSCVKRARSE